eukprot:Hpha_TRINITY_DN16432_c0_g4::TRINITY_DN16432_c0_g4_i2::g.162575::m.162575
MESLRNRCWMGCSGWIMRDSDSPEDAYIKRLATPAFTILTLVITMIMMQAILGDRANIFRLGALVVMFVSTTNVLARGLVGASMRKGIEMWVLGGTFGICLLDAYLAAEVRDRLWPFTVIVLDAALVFDTQRPIPIALCSVVVYIAIVGVEAAAPFGLYKAAAMNTPPICDCAEPPCPIDYVESFNNWMSACLCLWVDFYLTRGFATDLRHQLRRVEASAKVTAEVTAALARYDVDVAEAAINSGMDLPEELAESFRHLLSNLRSYREYLPEILLRHDVSDAEGNGALIPAPRRPDGGEVDVGVVFTEIQSSTALWEECPQGMYEALQTHNSTLRGLARNLSGYEVKVIGDSLMLVFDSAVNAVMFGVEAQLQLATSEWPASLCKHHVCRRVEGRDDDVPLWNGLRVRMGINWGPAKPEKNLVTKRYDYLGSTVNTAASVTAALKTGGLTAVTQAVVDEVGLLPPGLGYESDRGHVFYLERDGGKKTLMAPMGERELRGVTHPILIHIILPWPLAERWRSLSDTSQQSPVWEPAAVSAFRGGVGGNAATRHRRASPTLSEFSSPLPSPLEIMSEEQQQVNSSKTSFPEHTDPQAAATVHAQPAAKPLTPTLLSSPSLSLGLAEAVGTVATVRGAFRDLTEVQVEGALTKLLAVTETASHRTGGQVVCVVSGMCVVGWNAGSRCLDHVAQSAYFVGLLKVCPPVSGIPSARVQAHTGAATGKIVAGNISGMRMRYVTVAGGCVELSAALAESAAMHNLPFMAAGDIGTHLGRERLASRICCWTELGGDEQTIFACLDDTETSPRVEEAVEEERKSKLIEGVSRRYQASFIW